MAAAGALVAETIAHVGGLLRPGVTTEELDDAAGAFIREHGGIPTSEGYKGYPKAMLGLLKVMARSRQAGIWARDWALLRQHPAFDEIMLAALLHDFAEILMWCFAPSLATRLKERQAAAPHLRSSALQNEEYGVVLDELAVELGTLWGLPQLLVTLMNPANANSPNVKNVKLAVDLARHTAVGWNNPALPDDFQEIEAFLHQGHSHFLERIGAPETLVTAARQAEESEDPLAS